jgi:ribosome maturation factor RimP
MASPKNQLLEKIEALATPVLAEHQAELVNLEYLHEHGNWVLRFFVDKPGGITLDDCATLSDHLGRTLDATDPIPQGYSLEVSSPGIFRPLRKEKDFRQFLGERVEVKLCAPIEGRRNFRGTLTAADPENVTVIVEGKTVVLPFSGIAKANLDPEITI